MSETTKVAVVTGANKGLGLELVRNLLREWDGLVYLTSRDETRGKAAVEELKRELPEKATVQRLRYHQLDITSEASIQDLRDYLRSKYGRLDILMNNAGMAFKQSSTASFAEQARVTVETNYFGTRRLCDSLFPLLAHDARVVFIASRGGTIAARRMAPDLLHKFAEATSVDEVDALMRDFIDLAEKGEHEAKGYPATPLGMSKLGLIAASERMAKTLEAKGEGILVNAACPGHMKTDMSSHQGLVPPSEGAETPTWLALLPSGHQLNAAFLAEKKSIQWRLGQTIDEFPGFPKDYFKKK